MAYSWKNDPTNPDAKPLYNDNILKVWNWFDDVWGCSDWVTWHKSMVKKYGLTAANTKFLKDWDNLATGSSAIDCRTFNSSFKSYVKSVGLFDHLFAGVGVIAQPISGAVTVLGDVGDSVANLSKGVKNTSKIIAIILPIVVVVAVILISLHFYKKTNGGK
jgi:hypothetical protein